MYTDCRILTTRQVINIDTYFSVDSTKCTDCFMCVPTCPHDFIERTEWFHPIFKETIVSYGGVCDYTPCHHCNGFWEDKTPCQEICPNDAIELSRW